MERRRDREGGNGGEVRWSERRARRGGGRDKGSDMGEGTAVIDRLIDV